MENISKNYEVKRGLATLQGVSVFAPTAQYLRGRFIFEATLDQVGWGCWSSETEVWFREYFGDYAEPGDLVCGVWDCDGVEAGVRLWPVPTYDGRGVKRRAPKGMSAKGKVMACPRAVAALRGDGAIKTWIIAEGEPDFLSCVQIWGAAEDVGIVGIVSGSWTPDFGAKVAGGSRVVLRVHADGAGDTYAASIARTLGEGVEVWRYQEPDAERPKPRDQNELLAGGLLWPGMDPLYLCHPYSAPPLPAPAPTPAAPSKREEDLDAEDGWRLARAALYWEVKWGHVLGDAQGRGGTHADPKGWSAQGLLCMRAAHGLQARAHKISPAQMERIDGAARALATLDPKTMEAELERAALAGAGSDEDTQKNRRAKVAADAKRAARTALDMDGLCQKIDGTPKKKDKKKRNEAKPNQAQARTAEPDFWAEPEPSEPAANEDGTPPQPHAPVDQTPNKDPLAPFSDDLLFAALDAWTRAQLRAVRIAAKGVDAVVDATHAPDMDLESWGRVCDAKPWHRIPSESEMAWRLLERLQPPGAPSPVADEGTLWAYDPGTGLWAEADQDRACLMMALWDGAEIKRDFESDDPPETVRVNKRSSEAVYALALRYAKVDGFFTDAPHGFMTHTGFWLVDLDKKSISLMEKNPSWRARHLIDVDLTRENHSAPMLSQYLSTVHAGHDDADERVTLMGEAIFVALTGLGPYFKRAVMLQGQGGSGKSQLLDMIKFLIPKRARCVVAPQFMGEEYYCAKLAGMMLNLVTDIEAGEIIKEGSIKAIVHGEDVHGRNPYGRPFTVAPRALHMFSCNSWPAAPGVSDAFWDRWIAVKFEHRFRDGANDIKDIGKHIAKHELNAMVTWAVNCGIRLLQRGKYTIPASTSVIMREWQNEGDSVAAWRTSATEPAQDMTENGRKKWWGADDAYQHYKDWCGKNGHRGIVNSTNFGKRLKNNDVAWHRFNWGIVYAIQERRPPERPPDFL